MNHMTPDRAFIADMDRAARRVRAAIGAALQSGLAEADVDRLVAAGKTDVAGQPLTLAAQARGARMGVHPTGEDVLPTPRPAADQDAEYDEVGGFAVPLLHPAVASHRTHAAA